MCRDLGDKQGASDFVRLSLVSSLAQIACFAPVREKTTLTFIIRRENLCGTASASSADNTPIPTNANQCFCHALMVFISKPPFVQQRSFSLDSLLHGQQWASLLVLYKIDLFWEEGFWVSLSAFTVCCSVSHHQEAQETDRPTNGVKTAHNKC